MARLIFIAAIRIDLARHKNLRLRVPKCFESRNLWIC
jgi:hypothetical protein